MTAQSPELVKWQEGTLGRAVAAAEAQLLTAAMDDVFGLELLQLGIWGPGRELVRSSRIRRQTIVGTPATGQNPDIVANPAGLPINGGAIDAVLLPHCLETEPDPGAVLREADRILVGEGQVIILGFLPLSLWGLRSAASAAGFPPGLARLLPESRVRDWLGILGFEVAPPRHYLHVLPTAPGGKSQRHASRMLRRGWFNPLPAGGYLLKARKRLYTPTPLRPRRRELAPFLGSLVNPSA